MTRFDERDTLIKRPDQEVDSVLEIIHTFDDDLTDEPTPASPEASSAS